MFFLPLPLLLAEVMIFTTWIHFFDFWDVVFAYFIPSVIGAMLLARSGQNLMMTLKTGIVPGQMPGNRLLRQGARLVGALALIIPLFLSRVLAVFLITPGLNHLSIWFFKAFLFKKLSRAGGFSFVNFGGPNPGRSTGWQSQPGTHEYYPQERDATVVDITPLKVTHTSMPADSDPTKPPRK